MQIPTFALASQLEPASSDGVPSNVTCEKAVLAAPLAPGKATTLETYAVLTHQLTPRPREIGQGDPQRVVLRASQHILSPYRMASESLQVNWAAARPLMATCICGSLTPTTVSSWTHCVGCLWACCGHCSGCHPRA